MKEDCHRRRSKIAGGGETSTARSAANLLVKGNRQSRISNYDVGVIFAITTRQMEL